MSALPIAINDQTLAAIDELATATASSREHVIDDALRLYLDVQSSHVARIHDGIAAADAGRTEPAADVFARIARRYGWQT